MRWWFTSRNPKLIDAVGMKTHWWDPYNQNTLKADRPIFGHDWFINLGLVSDTVFEPRGVPTPVANQEFSVDELMSSHFLQIEKSGQLGRVWRPVGQGPNPYGSIHQDQSGHLSSFGRRRFTAPGHVARVRLRTEQGSKALVSGMPYQSFKTQSHGLRIRGRATSCFRLCEEFVINQEGFLHTYDYAIFVWLLGPYSRQSHLGNAKATYTAAVPPALAFPPVAEITTYCRPFTS